MVDLVDRAWRLYHEADAPCVLKPAIPILYFGDSAAFSRSPLRVVTVGLNPSGQEFLDGAGLRRFGAARGIYPAILTGTRRDAYRAALDGYFLADFYASWFAAFEPLRRHSVDT